MTDIDEKIRKTLNREEAELFDELTAKQTIFAMVIGSFRSMPQGLAFIGFAIVLLFSAAGIYALLELLEADSARDQVLWATAFLFSLMMVMFLKVWYWMEMNKNAITREIKRVELQIASLAARPPS